MMIPGFEVSETWRWAIGLFILPLIWWIGKKIAKCWRAFKGLFKRIDKLEDENKELREKISAELEQISKKIDRNSEEHGELGKEVREIKNAVTVLRTNQDWIMSAVKPKT